MIHTRQAGWVTFRAGGRGAARPDGLRGGGGPGVPHRFNPVPRRRRQYHARRV